MKSSEPHALHREELIFLLSEAAEIEHCLMCCYLYAAFSLRPPTDQGLSPREAEAVKRWRADIRAVALEEMVHLTLVQNLLVSIGAAPHLQRPNFPIQPGVFPSGLVVELRPFEGETLNHFIFLERPEDLPVADGESFQPPQPFARSASGPRLTASAQDYATIGALYRGIERSFEHLSDTLGEANLFVGARSAQVDSSLLQMDGVQPVTDLSSARRAIERIIEQGEGAKRGHEISHFARFTRVRDELESMLVARPGFAPAYPVVRNPVMNPPPDPRGRSFVDSPSASRVLDLSNAVYALIVQCLARFFAQVDEDAARRLLIDSAIALMGRALAPLAAILVTLPASTALAGLTAGTSFTLPRSTHAFPQRLAGWELLRERTAQLGVACALMTKEEPRLAPVQACLEQAERALGRCS